MVSLTVNIGDKSYRDKLEISTDEIYEKIKEGIDIKTSLPLAQDLLDAFTTYAKQGIDFIYLSISSELSGSYSLANNILDEVKQYYPNLKAGIIDTKTSALGIGIMLYDLHRKIDENNTFEEVFETAQALPKHVITHFMVNDLSQLIKGGRVGKAKGAIASILHIRPILQVDEGIIKPKTQARGSKKALKKLVEIVEEASYDKNQIIAINYSNNRQLADDLIEELKRVGFNNFIYEPIGSVLSSHFGLDAVGVFLIDTFIK